MSFSAVLVIPTLVDDGFDYEDTPTLREPNDLDPPGHDEIKENQWLGVTVKSQKPGGKVVVCAHRYIQSANLTLYHYGMGLCYVLNKTLEAEGVLEPCKGRPTEKLHQQYGFCQVGTSLAFLNDGFTLMGAPGPYTWRGTFFAKDVVGSFLQRDNTVYRGPLNDNPTPINKYSYLGMSVTGGHFFDRTIITYVSGAPRSNLTGQVFFFNKTASVEELTITLNISGTQFGSSFGYEILAVDINQDGYDELLVAAPFYYESENKIGGAVYYYSDLRRCNIYDGCKYKAKYTGKEESRFGFSMTSLGDINKDGFVDVAIGAPYEEGGGAVYIYLGQKGGLSPEPSQIIKHRGHKTIGYSMSGGLDMDLNEYPDLLIGAYESDEVILYKTRPIIDISITVDGKELNNINASKKGCQFNQTTDKTCFSFKTCFTLSKFKSSQPVEIKYEIKEATKKSQRVTFQNDLKYVNVTPSSEANCIDEVAYLVESNGDILTPILLQVNYNIQQDKPDSPILNKTSVKTFQATFQKNCGDDDVCYSNLTLYAGTRLPMSEDGYILDMGKNKEFVLDANIINSDEAAYEAKLFVRHPEGLSYVALQTEKNKASGIVCTANNESTLVTCNLGNPFQGDKSANLSLRFEIANTKQQKLDLQVFVNSTSTERSTQTSQNLTVILQKIASYLIKGESRPPNIIYSGDVKGQSAMKYLEDIGPRVIHSYDVINQGDWNIRNLRVEIQWPYQVYTDREEGGKWLLYLEKEPSIDFNTTNHCSVEPASIVNKLKLKALGIEEESNLEETQKVVEPPTNVRRKRDVEETVRAETMGPEKRQVVPMDCIRKTALCAKITCTIPQLNENSQIKINIFARVWNSTLIEDYRQIDWVSINSVAEIIIDDPSIIINRNNSVGITSIETRGYPSVVLADTGVNIWIIIGSVIAGLLLLIIVIIILYKCGFFKRNRVNDQTLSANLMKQGENETLLTDADAKQTKK
ncbi:hypothetical protein Zmor_023047 [Zophobas morio]|uniref:Integrin alpha-PS1 n=1 Tax=Zophobas morio TaxID=2755281 RepID=A0AA38M6Q7_9CUCU|nr:hypothetical protein Zmor_023047 [Zophobas morio]